jgi:hypothetical protein
LHENATRDTFFLIIHFVCPWDCSSRSVEEVGIPTLVAKILTVPEFVTVHNKRQLQSMVFNGANQYPGANYVKLENGDRMYVARISLSLKKNFFFLFYLFFTFIFFIII